MSAWEATKRLVICGFKNFFKEIYRKNRAKDFELMIIIIIIIIIIKSLIQGR